MERTFSRSYESLSEIFDFTAGFFRTEDLDRRMLHDVDFTLEELFTNMVKYSRESEADIEIDLERSGDGVRVEIRDHDVEPFDVTRAPEVDVHAPIEERTPGGLGLHLIRHLVDELEYEYDPEQRSSAIRFSKHPPAAEADG